MKPISRVLQAAPKASRYCVAYSGGLDSTVLLHLAHGAALPGLMALHVHHGLQAAADNWAHHCGEQCRAWDVPFQVLRVSVDAHHPQGPEAAAREARYAAFSTALPEGTVLLTAHHAGDQSETILLRLLRGTGIEGLAAMAEYTAFGKAGCAVWRPLLRVPRAALESYAQTQGLRWLDDPHNGDARYARSWLRTEVMTPLRDRWPDADAQLARVADHASDARELLQGLAARLLIELGGEDGSLPVPGLLALTPAERRLLLRHWLQSLALPPPFAHTLVKLDREVLAAADTAQPLLRWPGGEFRRYRGRLYAGPVLAEVPHDLRIDWDGREPLVLPAGLGTLSAATPQPMQVRFEVPGLRIRLDGAPHSRSLKQLSQEAGVPPWWRGRLPVVFIEGTVASIAGRWNTAGAPVLHWHHPKGRGLPTPWQS